MGSAHCRGTGGYMGSTSDCKTACMQRKELEWPIHALPYCYLRQNLVTAMGQAPWNAAQRWRSLQLALFLVSIHRKYLLVSLCCAVCTSLPEILSTNVM